MIIPWVPLYREGGFIISCGAWNRTDLKGFSKPFIESILTAGSLDYSIMQPSQNANHVCICQDGRVFWVVCDRCSELTDSPTSNLCGYIHATCRWKGVLKSIPCVWIWICPFKNKPCIKWKVLYVEKRRTAAMLFLPHLYSVFIPILFTWAGIEAMCLIEKISAGRLWFFHES